MVIITKIYSIINFTCNLLNAILFIYHTFTKCMQYNLWKIVKEEKDSLK